MTLSFTVLDLANTDAWRTVDRFLCEQEIPEGEPDAMFNSSWWGNCNQAIVAKEEEKIVGIVIMAIHDADYSGRPSIKTVYVPKEHSGKGLGYKLMERAIKQLAKHGINKGIVCVATNSRLLSIIKKLPQDLRITLDDRDDTGCGDYADEF